MTTLPARSVFALAAGLALLTLSANDVRGQTHLGVRGGITVGSVSGDVEGTFDKSNRTGFIGGVFLDFVGTGLLGFQVGAQYTQKGAELDFGGAADELSLDYLEIPAVVKLGIPFGGAVKPSVFAGAALGFNTGCDTGGQDCGDDLKGTEFSGIIGADLMFGLESVSLFIDGRYHVGFNDLVDSESFQLDKLKNRAWALQVGLGFPLGG